MPYITETIQTQAVKALQELVAQPSFNQAPSSGAPFGKGIRMALDQILAICNQLGIRKVTTVTPKSVAVRKFLG